MALFLVWIERLLPVVYVLFMTGVTHMTLFEVSMTHDWTSMPELTPSVHSVPENPKSQVALDGKTIANIAAYCISSAVPLDS